METLPWLTINEQKWLDTFCPIRIEHYQSLRLQCTYHIWCTINFSNKIKNVIKSFYSWKQPECLKYLSVCSCDMDRPVKIIRLVGTDTVEEMIYSRAMSKLQLTNTVIKDGQIQVPSLHTSLLLSALPVFSLLTHFLLGAPSSTRSGMILNINSIPSCSMWAFMRTTTTSDWFTIYADYWWCSVVL